LVRLQRRFGAVFRSSTVAQQDNDQQAADPQARISNWWLLATVALEATAPGGGDECVYPVGSIDNLPGRRKHPMSWRRCANNQPFNISAWEAAHASRSNKLAPLAPNGAHQTVALFSLLRTLALTRDKAAPNRVTGTNPNSVAPRNLARQRWPMKPGFYRPRRKPA